MKIRGRRDGRLNWQISETKKEEKIFCYSGQGKRGREKENKENKEEKEIQLDSKRTNCEPEKENYKVSPLSIHLL